MSQDPRADFDIVASEVGAISGATLGAMFGMPCLKDNGKVFARFDKDSGSMVFKLRGEPHARALSLRGRICSTPPGVVAR